MRYKVRMNSITFQLQKITLLFKYELNITEPVHKMIRNIGLLNKVNKINQTTHDIELENNGTESM